MARVNYVIACWMGGRRAEDRRSLKDRSFFLRQHLQVLETRRHQIDLVTIVLARGGDDNADALARAIKSAGDTPVEVLERENTGYSYASWNHAFETYGDRFTHYILIEDDYAPWVDDFDSILIAHANRKNTYVCSKQSRNGFHGAISNGVIPYEVWKRCHPAPWVDGVAVRDGNASQRIWTAHFCKKGFPLQDHTDTHSSPFWDGRKVVWYGDTSKPPLFMPVHAFDQTLPVSYAGEMMSMSISGLWDLEIKDRR